MEGLLFWRGSIVDAVFLCLDFLSCLPGCPASRQWMSPFLSSCPPQEPSPRTREKFGCFSKFTFGLFKSVYFSCPCSGDSTPSLQLWLYVVSLLDRQLDDDTRARLKRLVIVCPSLWIRERERSSIVGFWSEILIFIIDKLSITLVCNFFCRILGSITNMSVHVCICGCPIELLCPFLLLLSLMMMMMMNF